MSDHWETFYEKQAKPQNYERCIEAVSEFIRAHPLKKIALVSDFPERITPEQIISIWIVFHRKGAFLDTKTDLLKGGTTVPMEHNTVRFVDNFSAGTRGSASTEYFLSLGYNVIFLYRLKSLEPFGRHVSGTKILQRLTIDEDNRLIVKEEDSDSLLQLVRKYEKTVSRNGLLKVPFETLADYLWYLRGICEQLTNIKRRTLLYLAAAVSDFYIPSDQMSEHKIQSGDGPLSISLQLVPKMLTPLTSIWLEDAYIVSFKLETNEKILISKARGALEKYKHNLVIGNLLQTRKQRVIMVTKDKEYPIMLSDEEIKKGVEIEEYIVREVSLKHENFIKGLDN